MWNGETIHTLITQILNELGHLSRKFQKAFNHVSGERVRLRSNTLKALDLSRIYREDISYVRSITHKLLISCIYGGLVAYSLWETVSIKRDMEITTGTKWMVNQPNFWTQTHSRCIVWMQRCDNLNEKRRRENKSNIVVVQKLGPIKSWARKPVNRTPLHM